MTGCDVLQRDIHLLNTQGIYGTKPIYSWAKPEEFMDEVLYAWLDEHIREVIGNVSHLNERWLCTFIDCHQIC